MLRYVKQVVVKCMIQKVLFEKGECVVISVRRQRSLLWCHDNLVSLGTFLRGKLILIQLWNSSPFCYFFLPKKNLENVSGSCYLFSVW